MNLSRRASFLILPVIFVSYALAALAVYEQQSQSIQNLEQNKLDLRLKALQSEFSSYNRFIDAYLVSLLEGEALARFIREPDNIYKERILSSNLRASIERFFNTSAEFASLSLIGPNHEVLFYVENSIDPFSTVRTEQLDMALDMRASRKLNLWQHHRQASTSLIQQGSSIDSRTLSPPHITQLENTIQVVVAATPSKFDNLLLKTKNEFQANIEFSQRPIKVDDRNNKLHSVGKLKTDYFITITPAPKYLSNLLWSLEQQLIITVLLGALITFSLLQLLIKRFITSPISKLDRQLTEVIKENRQNIEAPNSQDEIGRLGRKFHDLYKQLHSSFHESHIQSRTDALTQLPNRAAFYEAASYKLSESEKEQTSLSITYIDLDNFKFVNDKYGHEVGDQLLKTVAVRINHIVSTCTKEQTSKRPNVYRLSGDEFIVMLPKINTKEAQHICDKVLQLFAEGYHFEQGNFPVTASIGIATYPQDGHTLSQLVSNADLAMYQAKRSGKNRHATYSLELAKKDRQAKEIENKLKDVHLDKEFTLFYMPIVDINGGLKGCEALLRWNSADLGSVSPALFIPIAEQTGMFKKIDLWVVEKAFQDYTVLTEFLDNSIELSLNISSAEIGSDRFISAIKKLCLTYSITPRNFVIEITETFSMKQEKDTLSWLDQLRELGFKIAIDDFGTGYTSLMQMVDYPVDTIKFDKKLIDRLTQPDKQSLAKALIELCHLQHIEVVAEGIETLADYKTLQNAGCDFQQGFYIAKPMSIEDLRLWSTKKQPALAKET